jgi:hypothetical protein
MNITLLQYFSDEMHFSKHKKIDSSHVDSDENHDDNTNNIEGQTLEIQIIRNSQV